MSLHSRLLLIIGLVMALAFAGLEVLSYQRMYAEMRRDVLSLSENIYGILMATRRVYHRQFLSSNIPLTSATVGFLPAYALSRISKDYANWNQSGITFNNVSDRARNPNNQADPGEMEIIHYFQDHPDQQEYLLESQQEAGVPYFHYARPIWIEKYCLQCHGKRAEAPPTIRDLYQTGFDYQEGDLRGILSIKIPSRDLTHQVLGRFFQDLALHFSAFFLLFLLLSIVIRRNVGQPLAVLGAGMARIASGDHKGRLDPMTGDFTVIVQSFNHMAEEIHRRQTAALASKERFRAVARSVSDALVSMDAQGGIVFWNEGAQHIFGYPEQEILNQPVTRLMPTCYHADFQLAMETIRHNGNFFHDRQLLEFHGVRQDGTLFPIELTLSSWVEDDKRYFTTVIRDTTERKQNETRLKETMDHLFHSENRLDQIINNARAVIFLKDVEGRYLLINHCFEEFFR